MVPTSTATNATVLGKAVPERRFGTGGHPVGTNSNHPQAIARVLSSLTGLEKEVDATIRPRHAPVAIREERFSAASSLDAG